MALGWVGNAGVTPYRKLARFAVLAEIFAAVPVSSAAAA
eukprot:COSAG01_NODE_1300_length_10830_cov_25.036716_10_plen_39_part_00